MVYSLKKPDKRGRTHLALSPLQFLKRVAAIIPPPRFNVVRYHGVLASASRLRSAILRKPPPPTPAAAVEEPLAASSSQSPPPEPDADKVELPRDKPAWRMDWATLMRRA